MKENTIVPKQEEAFRDKISTVDDSGKRAWVYPKKPKGKLYNARTVASIVFLTFLFGAPFIKVNGEQLLLFNILEGKFVLFGLIFGPQDFHLFALAMLTFMVFIVLFTVVFGRVFCGWACPQTIFMEMVFRKIEYWIEGDFNQQKKLNKAPWTAKKIRKKVSKHLIFFAISFLIGNTFLAYIIGLEALQNIITSSPSEHLAGFAGMIVFSGIFYFVFAHFREQVCLVACPYGRLQGVLLNDDSIVVAYDFERGEPRGNIRKKKEKATPQQAAINVQGNEATLASLPTLGDCIDCNLCVKVCPTGIDIRNGTQLECVNCTACIDACNEVMDKVNRPQHLIRYDSFNGIKKGVKLRFTPRIAAYSAVLVLLLSILSFSLANRNDVEATVLRAKGMLYNEVDEHTLSNLYNVTVKNKTNQAIPVTFKLVNIEGTIKMVGEEMTVPAEDIAKSVFFIELPKTSLTGRKTSLQIEVYSGSELLDKTTTTFLGPIPTF